MFGYLKEKLKGAVDKFSSEVDEESADASEEELKEQENESLEKKDMGKVSKAKPKVDDDKKKQKGKSDEKADEKTDEKEKEKKEEIAEESKEAEETEEKEEKGGWFSRLWKRKEEKPVEPEETDESEETEEVYEAIEEKEVREDEEGEKEATLEKEKGKKGTKQYKKEEPETSLKEEKFPEQEEETEKKEDSESEDKQGIKDGIIDGIKEDKIKSEVVSPVKSAEKKKKKHKETKESKKIKEEALEEKEEVKDKKKELETQEEKIDAEEEKETTKEPAEGESKGFFGRFRDSVYDAVTKKSISEKKFDELFWDIEMVLLENNVAVEVIEKIKLDLKKELVEKKIRRGNTVELITDTLKDSINDLFVERLDLIEKINQKKPYVMTFVGVNGSGKTTSIAKLAYKLKQMGYNPVIAAADTFRAAAIQQLEEHANNIGVKMIKHDYGADPAAVCFDAIKYANSKKMDIVLIDTAGRLHSNANLVDEMKKIVRVAQPDLKVFVGESTTGNDCIEQAQRFNDAIGIDGIILAKTDVDSKGGAAISVSYVTGKPIIYIGTGQDYNDLTEFDPKLIAENLGLST